MREANYLPLEKCWLYAVASPRDLARRLSLEHKSLSEADLRRLSADTGNYKIFLNKAGRLIEEPVRELQFIHKRIHVVLSRIVVPAYLHSAIKGKSYLSNARAHKNDVPVVKVDVKKFFQSVPRAAINAFFLKKMKCRVDVAGLLADLLTVNGHLPTGGSASPVVSYYAFKDMFDEIHALASAGGLVMTCYVDDLAFSGHGATKPFLFAVKKVIAKYGLRSHKAKMFVGPTPKIVTGICITTAGEKVPNRLHLKIAEGFNALRATDSLAKKQEIGAPLLGRLHAAEQIDRKFGARARTLRAKLKSVHT